MKVRAYIINKQTEICVLCFYEHIAVPLALRFLLLSFPFLVYSLSAGNTGVYNFRLGSVLYQLMLLEKDVCVFWFLFFFTAYLQGIYSY